jgi:hypothetical protein
MEKVVEKRVAPSSLLEFGVSISNTLLAACLAFVAFSLRWTADTYATASSHPWYHMSNNSWIIVYITLSACSIVVLFIVRRGAFVCLGVVSLFLRLYALLAICAIHFSSTTVMKMDMFYSDCFYYGCVFEPILLVLGMFNGVKFKYLASESQEKRPHTQ